MVAFCPGSRGCRARTRLNHHETHYRVHPTIKRIGTPLYDNGSFPSVLPNFVRTSSSPSLQISGTFVTFPAVLTVRTASFRVSAHGMKIGEKPKVIYKVLVFTPLGLPSFLDLRFTMTTLDKGTAFRIISLTLAGGDVIHTIPGTWALYRKQWVRRKLSALCFFYAMARYMSIISLIFNGYNAFSRNYTPTLCRHIYMFPNVTALLAGMAVQVLVYIRTVAISGRSKYVRIGLGAVMLLGFPVQIFGIVYHRDPWFNNGACKGKVLRPGEPDWNIVYYSTHMVFDSIACATATYFLVASSRVLGVFHFSKLGRHVLRDGLLYFFVVFLANLWVVMEFAYVFTSGAASSLPLAVVLIAIQHLVLSTQSRTPGGKMSNTDDSTSVSRGLPRFNHSQSQQLDVELQSSVFVVSNPGIEPRKVPPRAEESGDKSSASDSESGQAAFSKADSDAP
ncbi:putative Transmembrane protein [Mycena venus]|uniref:Putative Transmembrane protein n=1 Tax=Mycena venus TaxID=2733690 RepID=A0A8H6U119_9AGAR|nr:putative Transmembrane protein [Mycena venus]